MLHGDGASNTGIDIVFARPRDPNGVEPDLDDLRDAGIPVRPFQWRTIQKEEALRISRTSLEPMVRPLVHDWYWHPFDGAANLLDCAFWLFFSDRVEAPLLPLRRYGALIFDLLQRYVPGTMTDGAWQLQRRALIPFTREAEVVLTTTPVTSQDLQAFVGVPRARIRQVPMFFTVPSKPAAVAAESARSAATTPYLLWVTNHSRHKNHLRTLRGLELYYEQHGGSLRTVIIGTETKYFGGSTPHPVPVVEEYVGSVREAIGASRVLRQRVTIAGEVSDSAYAERLAGARFLLHSCLYDNGTFTVLDAAALGVPSLSARYPAMTFMDREFGLNLSWFDPFDPKDLARQLLALERSAAPVPDGAARMAQLEQTHRTQSAARIREAITPWLTASA